MGRRSGSVGRRYLGMTLAERVLTRVDVRHVSAAVETPCWLWTGTVTSAGYGHIRAPAIGQTAAITVHRVMWVDRNGPVPDGLELDHLCETATCCNPGHLEAVTHLENVQRACRSRAR